MPSDQDSGRTLTRRDAPDYVNRPTLSILLQNQHAWPLRIVGVILDNHSRPQPIDGVTYPYRIRAKLFVSVK